MHLLAIGGAGEMGRAALSAMHRFEEIERITVADIDGTSAAATASAVGDKARPLTLDVLDERAMSRALQLSDLVVNFCGPFFRFGLPVLEQVVAAGRPYFDICDDPEPTLAMLRMDRAAREAGTTAVLGIGASPGLTNLLAVKAHEALDSTHRLVTAWNVDGRLAEEELAEARDMPTAAYVHWMRQLSGDISVYEHGARTLRRPLRPVDVDVPGYGRRTLYRVGHPEAVTLGRNFPQLVEAPNLMVLGTELRVLLSALTRRVDAGELQIEEAAERLAQQDTSAVGFGGLLRVLLSRLTTLPPMPELFALAEGMVDERPASAFCSLSAYPAFDMGEMTGVPLAVAVRLFLDGHIPTHGVHAPETAIDPDIFFDTFRHYCRVPKTPDSLDAFLEQRVV